MQEAETILVEDIVQSGFVPPHSCDHCAMLRVRRPDNFTLSSPEPWGWRSGEKFDYDTPLAQIQEQAISGCSFWSMVWMRVQWLQYSDAADTLDSSNLTHSQKMAELQDQHGLWQGESRSGMPDAYDPSIVRISVELQQHAMDPIQVKVTLGVAINQDIVENWATFLVLGLPVSLAAQDHMCVYPVNTNPGSKDSFNLIRTWLEHCRQEHDCKVDETPQSMPKRLLKLQKMPCNSRSVVQLVETSEITNIPYVALSYCWGKLQTQVLTQETYNQLKDGIYEADLAPTLKDAVVITRELGLQHLWVDALCIKQDDDTDKAAEISQMCEIYGNAVVTIAASRSSSVSEGFLKPRPRLGQSSPDRVFQLVYETQPGSKTPSHIILVPDFKEQAEPWDRRAWTLQERLLSKRVLKFGTLQTTWICQDVVVNYKTSDGWRGFDFDIHPATGGDQIEERMIQASKIVRQPNTPSAGLTEKETSTILNTWYHLLRMFTNRGLSYDTDRLPAMSGIAKAFAHVLQDEYICGHWKSSVAAELMWWSPSFGDGSPSRSAQYLAPSWSWAGYNRAIWEADDLLISDSDFAIIACHPELVHEDSPFGSVRSGQLDVRGLLCPVDLKLLYELEYSGTSKSWENPPRYSPEYMSRESMSIIMDYAEEVAMDLETFEYPEFPSPVFFLVLQHMDGDPAGLILLASDERNFKRLGIFALKRTTLSRRDGEDPGEFEVRRRKGLREFWRDDPRKLTIV